MAKRKPKARAGNKTPQKENPTQTYEEARDQVRDLLNAVDTTDLQNRYRIGCVVQDLQKASDKYGTGAVQRLARDVNLDDSTLYAYAEVAEVFSGEDIDKWAALRDKRGRVPIGISHLIEIASLTDSDIRTKLLQRTLAEGLSISELRKAGQEANAEPSGDPIQTAEREQKAEQLRASGLRRMRGSVDGFRSQLETYRDTVLPLLTAPPEASDKDLTLAREVDASLSSLGELLETLQASVASLLSKSAAENPAVEGQHAA